MYIDLLEKKTIAFMFTHGNNLTDFDLTMFYF